MLKVLYRTTSAFLKAYFQGKFYFVLLACWMGVLGYLHKANKVFKAGYRIKKRAMPILELKDKQQSWKNKNRLLGS